MKDSTDINNVDASIKISHELSNLILKIISENNPKGEKTDAQNIFEIIGLSLSQVNSTVFDAFIKTLRQQVSDVKNTEFLENILNSTFENIKKACVHSLLVSNIENYKQALN